MMNANVQRVTSVLAIMSIGLAHGGLPLLGLPTNLRVEGLLDGVAVISEATPRFTFTPPTLSPGSFGVRLVGVEINVTTSGGALVWASGAVATTSPVLNYAGPPLKPFTHYSWTVAVVVGSVGTTVTSAGGVRPAHVERSVSAANMAKFETGPMAPTDWGNATWLGSSINGPDQFRLDFMVPPGTVQWARVYLASAGCAAVLVNSKVPAVDLRGICPWSVGGIAAGMNVRYMTHDITLALTSGKNAVGILGGNVMVPSTQVVAIIAVEMEGSAQPLLWTTASPGWQQRSESYYHEATAWKTAVDWRMEEAGWASPGFIPHADSTWGPATPITGPLPLRALQMPLSAVLDEVKPVRVEALAGGDFLYTFPKNFVGTIKIKALPSAADGSNLTVTSGEWLSTTPPAPPTPPMPPPAPQCGIVKEQSALVLGGCPAGKPIYDIIFASFGTPGGSCDTGFVTSSNCSAKDSLAVVKAACVGKVSCIINATTQFFNQDPCPDVKKWLAIEAACGPPEPCGIVGENTPLVLGGCPPEQVIADVVFASYGTPSGSCATGFEVQHQCNAAASLAVVKAECLGKPNCTVFSSNTHFGLDPCLDTVKHLAAKITCGKPVVVDTEDISTQRRVLAQADPLPPLPPAGTGTWPQISGQEQTTQYTLRAGNTADIETLFCWHGFQYVRVTPQGSTGFAGGLEDIVGLDIHTNMTQTGFLVFGGDGVPGSESERAAAVLAGINSMTLQSQRTNVAAYIPTDCPTREKHGWMGDALDASEQAMFNFDILAVHVAFMQSIEDNQGPGGDVPVVIPAGIPGNGSCSDIAWTSAYPQITNMLYSYYGDERVVARHWKSLVTYQENLLANAAKNPAGLAECDQFKDWLCGNGQSCCTNTPVGSACPVAPEMGSFNYILGLRAMASMAEVLGNAPAAQRYNSTATAATGLFHNAFWSAKFGEYGGDAGAVQSLTTPALFIDSPPANLYPKVLQTLEQDLVEATGYSPMVGAVTSKILLNVLSDNGLHDTALRTATTTNAPSWGFWWSRNSSTCWESWPLDGGHGAGTVNHIFLCGGVGEWMWKHLVGLAATAPLFAQVTVHPRVHPVLGPATLSGSYQSPSGVISSSWRVSTAAGAPVELNTTLPLGVSGGTIVVPKPFTSTLGHNTTLCKHASEVDGGVLTLACPAGATIDLIVDAFFGTPLVAGVCSTWGAGSCNSPEAAVVATVEKRCLGQSTCTLSFNDGGGENSTFPDPCSGTVKTLAVHAACTPVPDYAPTEAATVTEAGAVVWDGKQLVGSHQGIAAARDTGDGIAFEVYNGAFQFVSHPL